MLIVTEICNTAVNDFDALKRNPVQSSLFTGQQDLEIFPSDQNVTSIPLLDAVAFNYFIHNCTRPMCSSSSSEATRVYSVSGHV